MSSSALPTSTSSPCYHAGSLSARATLAIMAFLMFLITQMMRINVYIVLLALGKENVKPGNQTCEITAVSEWNENKLSIFMGAFYWSYWATELPGGMLTQKFGGKRIMGICVTIAAALNFLLPAACNAHFLLASVIRALQGLSLGVTWPAMHWLSGRWIPQADRSKFMSSYHGAAIGTSITYPLSGLIIAQYGWEFVFYFIGIVSLIWCLAWWLLIYDSPADHPNLSEAEAKYLREALGHSVRSSKNFSCKTPWREILCSKSFWAVLIASQGLMWGTITFSMQIPTYFYQVHNLDIKSSGLLSGIPEISKFFFALFFSAIIDKLITKQTLTVTAARKLAVAVSEIIPAILLFLLGTFGFADKILATVILTGICLVGGASSSGSLANVVDISPNHAGTLLGIIKTLTVVPGVISPILVTHMTSGDGSQDKPSQWKNVFILIAIIYIVCSSIFLAFGSGKIQPWNKENDDSKSKEKTGFLGGAKSEQETT